jgi:hypothetical protein
VSDHLVGIHQLASSYLPLTWVSLVCIRVKAHKDYGPNKDPAEGEVEYGNYNVTDIEL